MLMVTPGLHIQKLIEEGEPLLWHLPNPHSSNTTSALQHYQRHTPPVNDSNCLMNAGWGARAFHGRCVCEGRHAKCTVGGLVCFK